MPGRLVLRPNEERALRRGRLWIFADEIAELAVDAPGGLVHVFSAQGTPLGTAYANPHSKITARMLSGKCLQELKPAWWRERLSVALRLRERLIGGAHWRWVHGEGDRLPGLVVDRFGEDIVVQAHTAGIDRELERILDAIEAIAAPRAIYLNHRIASRVLEGLAQEARLARGKGEGWLEVREGGLQLRAHALLGQKTGYFYDQRDNRLWVRSVAKDARMLDVFCYLGSFALQALAGGAKEAWAIDGSRTALELAEENAAALGFADRFRTLHGDAMRLLAELFEQKERFDLIVCDPPAFAKSQKERSDALVGYEKLAFLAARLVSTGGLLCLASCSGVVSLEDFRKACLRGVRRAGRAARVVRVAGAACDHPWPIAMPQLQYLKFLGLVLDG